MASEIAHIRKDRKVPAKIGKRVTYAGHPYRIAWANGGALILRSELRVHPTDPNLNYTPPDVTEETNQRHIKELEKLVTIFTDEDRLNQLADLIRRYPNESVLSLVQTVYEV